MSYSQVLFMLENQIVKVLPERIRSGCSR